MDPVDDPTSDYEESIAGSEFTSVSESRLRHHFENGRRYQGLLEGRYGLPNDEPEQIREGLKHKLYIDNLLDGKLWLAPIGDHPQKIVDLGTGFGYWATDVAEKYPGARIIGTDISPIQPLWAAPNVEFRVEDLEDEHRPWTSIYGGADLFFIRALLQTVRNPRRMIERCFENLKPGGWIEIHENAGRVYSADRSVNQEHPMNRIWELVRGPFADVYGWNLYVAEELPGMLRAIGFTNIQVRNNYLPIGRWSKDPKLRVIGSFAQTIVEDWVTAMIAKRTVLGLTEEEASQLRDDIFESFGDPNGECSLNWVDVWGQKPLT